MARIIILILCGCAITFFTTGANALQTSKMSPKCPTGGKEAEELHLLGRKYRQGAKGMPRDKDKAEQLFEQALEMGNARSALQIGSMYFSDYSRKYPEAKRHEYMIIMYNQALKMGCPDAYIALAKCYENGWGVRKDPQKTIELLQKGAEAGSPKGMEFYGDYLIREKGQIELGRQWLRRAIDMGNGDAGKPLSSSYEDERNAEGIIQSLRAGARQGSKACLLRLSTTYENGYYGQKKDKRHAACYDKLEEAIDDFDAPAPIKDFDRICPMAPTQPYKNT